MAGRKTGAIEGRKFEHPPLTLTMSMPSSGQDTAMSKKRVTLGKILLRVKPEKCNFLCWILYASCHKE